MDIKNNDLIHSWFSLTYANYLLFFNLNNLIIMNIDELTLGQIKQLNQLKLTENSTLNFHVGEKVIIRTYSAGVHFGTLQQKEGKEVLLINSRRMWRFWAAKSISLSGVAVYGLSQDSDKTSKICPILEKPLWLQAIEIIPLTKLAIKSLEEYRDAKAE